MREQHSVFVWRSVLTNVHIYTFYFMTNTTTMAQHSNEGYDWCLYTIYIYIWLQECIILCAVADIKSFDADRYWPVYFHWFIQPHFIPALISKSIKTQNPYLQTFLIEFEKMKCGRWTSHKKKVIPNIQTEHIFHGAKSYFPWYKCIIFIKIFLYYKDHYRRKWSKCI